MYPVLLEFLEYPGSLGFLARLEYLGLLEDPVFLEFPVRLESLGFLDDLARPVYLEFPVRLEYLGFLAYPVCPERPVFHHPDTRMSHQYPLLRNE